MVGVQTDMFAQESKIIIAVMRLFVRKMSDLATHPPCETFSNRSIATVE
jgi:hypothetical protein